MSFKLAKVIIHLKVGAQKNMVKGPAGWRRKPLIVVGHGIFSTAAYKRGTMFI